MASAEPIRIGAVDSAYEGYQSDLLQDVSNQGHHMLTCRAHVLGLILLQNSINPDLLSPLKILLLTNNEASSQVPHVPVGDRMLLNNHLRYCRVLQVGMYCGHFLDGGLRCIAWKTRGLIGSVFSKQKNRECKLKYLKKLFDNNNILCLQEVHGRDEYLQAIEVLAPRFRFFGTSFRGNENAGGSAVCIHLDLLLEEAIVTHLITCQGRDHNVNIQSGRETIT